MTGRLIVTGQLVVDLVLRIPALPPPGGDVFADRYTTAVGGDFIVMAAAARDGARVVYTGGHGVGHFSELARAAMRADGVGWVSARADVDLGFTVVMVDDSAERTFVSVRGAECLADPADLGRAAITGSDIVVVSGYSLLVEGKSSVLLASLPDLPSATRVAFDPGPLVASIPADVLAEVLRRTDICTSNEAEASVLWPAGPPSPSTGLRPGATIVVRTGRHGCEWWRGAEHQSVSGFGVQAVDTNGAGDTHTGVLLGALLAGHSISAAARRANAAAAIAVTRPGPAVGPTGAEIDRLLEA